jgi:hypothetical protein
MSIPKTNSTKIGWTKTAKGEYAHTNGHKVKKISQGWVVSGTNRNDGFVYGSMWAAMDAAAKTPAVFVGR